MSTSSKSLALSIAGMDCPTEEGLIRRALATMSDVTNLDFNLMKRRLTVTHRMNDVAPILAAISAVGMEAVMETPPAGSGRRTIYAIENMDCPTEEALIRQKLGTTPGVSGLEFNLVQRTVAVVHSLAETASVETALGAIGMRAVRLDDEAGANPPVPPAVSRRQWIEIGVSGLAAVLAEAAAFTLGSDLAWPVILLALLAIGIGGLSTYKKGWIALRHRNLNMNALMSIAVTGALLIGQFPEAAMVMVLFSLAEMIEALSLDRARNAIRGLLADTPDTATVQQSDGTWRDIDVGQAAIGMVARVRPGERIALDGVVVDGQSTVNQAPITGESMPAAKGPGDAVFAGTINASGAFSYRITADTAHSTMARIIHAVEQAQSERAPTQRFVDRFSQIYTPAVFFLALAVSVLPPLAFGMPWLTWIYRALVLLVIACPCALVISTPVTVVSGLAAAARRGILIKGGVYLEQGHRIHVLALDKTGTITSGRPAVTDIVALDGDQAAALRLAASIAARSDHPVSLAISQYWTAHGDAAALDEIEAFAALPGLGTSGLVRGQRLALGNRRLMERDSVATPEATAAIDELEGKGRTAVVLLGANGPLLVIGVADSVRPTSRDAIAQLHALGVSTIMLSGDNRRIAESIAETVGIGEARGDLLPEDKLAVIAGLEAKGPVGMVGDGINDAPALAKATIGFAMGAAGTDTAIETADVALMDDDLRKIPEFLRLSAKTRTVLMQNIVVALAIKVVFFALALLGHASLWMAVFADMGASLLVVANGVRLLRTSFKDR